MNDNEADGRTYPLIMARHGPGIALQRLHSLSLWNAIKGKAGGLGPVIAVVALAAGILLGTASSQLSNMVTSAASAFIDIYGYGAPLLIFVVLAPALSRIFSTRKEGAFGIYVVSWLAVSKVLAMLWAVAFTALIFGIPLMPDHAVSAGDALSQTFRSLLSTLVGSQFFWAIYVAVATGIVAIRVKPIATLLEKSVSAVEHAGQYLQPMIPAFMFAVGVYVQALPNQLNDQIGLDATTTSFQTVQILGLSMDANTTAGMVMIYGGGCATRRRRSLRLARRYPGAGKAEGSSILAKGLLHELLGQGLSTAVVHKLRIVGHAPQPLHTHQARPLRKAHREKTRRRRRQRPLHEWNLDQCLHPAGRRSGHLGNTPIPLGAAAVHPRGIPH